MNIIVASNGWQSKINVMWKACRGLQHVWPWGKYQWNTNVTKSLTAIVEEKFAVHTSWGQKLNHKLWRRPKMKPEAFLQWTINWDWCEPGKKAYKGEMQAIEKKRKSYLTGRVVPITLSKTNAQNRRTCRNHKSRKIAWTSTQEKTDDILKVTDP